MDTIKHNPARLYNLNETGITIVQHDTKILGLKGKRRISSLQFAERGSLVTVITCMSPTGHFIPPLLVFQKKKKKKKYETRTNEWHTAWINPHVPSLGVDRERDFFPVISSFIKYSKPTKEDPFLLVLDGQYSHTRNLELISSAWGNHVDIICLPPHSSH